MRVFLILLLLVPSWLQAHEKGPLEGHRYGRIDCNQSYADEFACRRVDLLAHLSLDWLAAGNAANDIWGWTDSLTGREYVLIGTFQGTVFVDITNPEVPVRLGMLPGHDTIRCSARPLRHDDNGSCAEGSSWRDIKVHADHAYVVSEATGHGMQVFDLRQLRDISTPQVFGETAWYGGFGSAHNLAINEQTGFAYALGSDRYLGGMHFIDLAVPAAPVAAGGYSADGYTHDAHCVSYRGPDSEHTGAEICLLSNEDTVTVVDVTDKNAPVMLARAGYSRASYTHQGWLDESHRWFYVNDELDEFSFGGRTRTYIWDMSDLDNPVLGSTYDGLIESIDHNNYVAGRYLFQSNYTSGLRILDISAPEQPLEVAWFDSFPTDDLPSFDGTWSNYPFFASGVIALSDIDGGLFLLRPTLDADLSEANLDVSIDSVTQPAPNQLRYRYVATVRNNGTADADDIVVSHVLDATASAIAVDGASCPRRGRIADCALGTLGGGESIRMTVEIVATTSGTKQVEVQTSARNTDPDTTDNKASQILSLQGLTTSPAPAPGGGGGGGGALLWLLPLAFFLLVSRNGKARQR